MDPGQNGTFGGTAIDRRRSVWQQAAWCPLILAVAAIILLSGPRTTDGADLTIDMARPFVVVPVTLPNPEAVLSRDEQVIETYADAIAERLLQAHADFPDQLLVLDVTGGILTGAQQRRAEQSSVSKDEASRYETAIARLLLASFEAAAIARDSIPVSVFGLPVESVGPDAQTADESNARYREVINALSAFVTRKSFILLRQGSSELETVRGSLSEAFRLRDGRPIIYRTNGSWRSAFESNNAAGNERFAKNTRLRDAPSGTLGRENPTVRDEPVARTYRDDPEIVDRRSGRPNAVRRGRSSESTGTVRDSSSGAGRETDNRRAEGNEESRDGRSDDMSSEPDSMSVATWHPLDVNAPEWIRPGILTVAGGKMFGQYNGDYTAYTADVIAQIESMYEPGEPVVLILQHWMQMKWTGGNPENIDKWGMFTHVSDRTSAGLAGIWPDAAIEYWTVANEYLFSELKSSSVNVVMLALDTEVQTVTGPYAFDGTHEAIMDDPRWDTEPLRGFDGMTAADLWPGYEPSTREYIEWIRMVGLHSFAHAFNEVLDATAMEHFPDLLISDYRWHDRNWSGTPDPDDGYMLRVRAEMIGHIMLVTGVDGDTWFQRGVGNTASPAWVSKERAKNAEELVEQYGADRVAPWITDRSRMQQIMGEIVTIHDYEQFLISLTDLGIKRYLWFPGGSSSSPAEQQIAVNALRNASR